MLAIILLASQSRAQQENPVKPGSETEQQLENLAEQQNGEPEDDSYLQTLVDIQKNKLNINTVDENNLKELQLLSDLQISALLNYRRLLGNLINIYELQAIPCWNVETIKKILPYIRVGNFVPFSADLKQRFTGGQQSLLLKWQQVIEKSNGYLRPDSVAIRYPGSPQKIFFRYKYNFRNLLQFGITGDKDAGEQFLSGNQKQGFDFYSIHLFARKLGIIKTLALGDFSVNLGQGLIHWQSLAFKKSADISFVKRQGEILHPYNSAGEYNFMRGAGISLGFKNVEFTAFASIHKLDGSLNTDTTQINNDYISSILNSGYHRTASEVAKKNAITQSSAGGNISYNNANLHIGINGIAFKFSVPLVRNIYPYNQFAMQGNNWCNYSVDYSYTYRNFHFFGEAATDKNNSKAFVSGLLASLDEKVDASLVYRNISMSYQALYGNAFTESTAPNNEKGLYAGLSIRPGALVKISAYADVFSFPWLRYRVDAPTTGSDYLLQINYNPNKKVEVYVRFKNENKAINLTGTNTALRQVYIRPKESLRTQVSYNASRQFNLSERVELLWFDAQAKDRSQQGFLIYINGAYKLPAKPFTLNGRLQYFKTDGFESRIYSYESDVLYSYSIPQFMGEGFRYYLNFSYALGKKVTLWSRWAQTIYKNQNSIGSGLDKIDGNKKSEIKFQIIYNF